MTEKIKFEKPKSGDEKIKELESENEKIALSNYSKPDLILDILSELDRDIKQDEAIKLLTFLICTTSRLKQPDRRKSEALKGDSCTGKDHLIKCTIKHFPDTIFLTAATKSVIEDDMKKYRIVAYSELNLARDEHGANALIVEQIKQMAAGGISSMKKDALTGFRSSKFEEDEQKTVLYGTTESEDDEELKTRFILGGVTADSSKISAVHKATLSDFAGLKLKEMESWIKVGIQALKDDDVIVPRVLVEDENEKPIFDTSDPRAMRDAKRFMALVAGMAYLYQLQRKKDKQGRIIAEAFDVLSVMVIAAPFFDHTYSGLGDRRLQACLDIINEYCDGNETDIFPRLEVEKRMGRSKNAVKGYLKGVSNLSLVGFSHKEGNDIYYKRYQKGVKKVLIGVKWKNHKEFLFINKGVKIPRNAYEVLEKLDNTCNLTQKTPILSVPYGNDTLKLTPLKKNEVQEEIILDNPIHHKCSICGDSESTTWDKQGRPICADCEKTLQDQQ